MPKQILPSKAEARYMINELHSLGYKELSKDFIEKEQKRMGLAQAPREQESWYRREFSKTMCHYEARLKTSLLPDSYVFANNHAAWGLIKSGDPRVYTHPRMHRTKNFIDNFLAMSETLGFLVQYRPLCKECHAYMEIQEIVGPKKESFGFHWVCNQNLYHDFGESHSFPLVKPIQKKLSKNAQRYWKQSTAKQHYYKKQCEKNNKPTGVARAKRKLWPIGNPQNIIK